MGAVDQKFLFVLDLSFERHEDEDLNQYATVTMGDVVYSGTPVDSNGVDMVYLGAVVEETTVSKELTIRYESVNHDIESFICPAD